MVLSAYSSSSSPSSTPAPRILLLLAINNADKAPKPAAFPQRLAMMYVFAQDLLDALAVGNTTTAATASSSSSQQKNQAPEEEEGLGEGGGGGRQQQEEESESERGTVVDIAVTTEPYFHAKSEAIARSGFYRGQVACTSTSTSTTSAEEEEVASSETEQIFLVGFDTLVRILDPKYYHPSPGMRAALDPLFARARLRVTARPGGGGAGDSSIAAQRGYLASLTEPQPSAGEAGTTRTTRMRIEQLGGRAEWARHRIDMVVEEEGEGREVSSTLARAAARRGDWEALGGLVSPRVARWVREEGEGVYGG
ncbi:hypothetical protein F4809DRAFT_619897 [Biscogniauxia mediterranea]|nr:hypothetical protein F4809DRAFT_619897 [Biscogniauxia mediterranea]